MAGKPFKVGRFAHTLRVRLMREHLGVDVDALYEEDFQAQETPNPPPASESDKWDPDKEQENISAASPKIEEDSTTRIKGESSTIGRMFQTAGQTVQQRKYSSCYSLLVLTANSYKWCGCSSFVRSNACGYRNGSRCSQGQRYNGRFCT